MNEERKAGGMSFFDLFFFIEISLTDMAFFGDFFAFEDCDFCVAWNAEGALLLMSATEALFLGLVEPALGLTDLNAGGTSQFLAELVFTVFIK